MAEDQIFVGDFGHEFIITYEDEGVPKDVSGASAQQVILKAPSGATKTKTTTWIVDGSDGRAKYVSEDGDFNESGAWQLQGKLTFGTSGLFHSNIYHFDVHAKIA